MEHRNFSFFKLRGANLKGIDLSLTNLKYAILDEADLEEAYLREANFENASLISVNLKGANLIYANFKDAILTKARLQNTESKKTSFAYADLEKAFLDDIEYDDVSLFYMANYLNARWETNPLLKREIDDYHFLKSFEVKCDKHWHTKFLYKIWGLTSDYGRSIKRWAYWSLGVVIFFWILFLLFGINDFDIRNSIDSPKWFTLLYFSIVTFTTLGFGDVTPTNWILQLIVILEVVIGYIMLGGLISIFANKLARRA